MIGVTDLGRFRAMKREDPSTESCGGFGKFHHRANLAHIRQSSRRSRVGGGSGSHDPLGSIPGMEFGTLYHPTPPGV